MTTRGRKPKPPALRVLQGNPGKRRIPKGGPPAEPVVAVPEPPEWLPELAAEKWRTVAPWLVGAKILTATDTHNLEAFCLAYSRLRRAEEEVAKYGIVLPGGEGFGPAKNPACTVANEALRQMASCGSSLGLDPAARTRLAAPADSGKPNRFAAVGAIKK